MSAELGRDRFVEGNTFGPRSLARRLPLVAHGEVRLGYAFRRWGVHYALVVTGRRYRAQPEPHRYGSLALTWRPR